ncbi:hypothetical protein FOFC_02916 [Fusarium oxysporum]|nr:hypothetical protein FOFC_02916 [Fusarium oxysporum]
MLTATKRRIGSNVLWLWRKLVRRLFLASVFLYLLKRDIPCLAANFHNSLSLKSGGSSDQNHSTRGVDEGHMQTAFTAPFLKSGRFVCRDDVLAKLQGLFFQGGHRKAALVGLGGLGKTQC